MKALSIQQPWAWLIANGWKDIENRSWNTHFRGRFLIHAGLRMSFEDYQACRMFVAGFAPGLADTIPVAGALPRGGIVGEAVLLDCVTEHTSEWFCGPSGFVLRNPKPLLFRPCKGQLGWFEAGAYASPSSAPSTSAQQLVLEVQHG